MRRRRFKIQDPNGVAKGTRAGRNWRFWSNIIIVLAFLMVLIGPAQAVAGAPNKGKSAEAPRGESRRARVANLQQMIHRFGPNSGFFNLKVLTNPSAEPEAAKIPVQDRGIYFVSLADIVENMDISEKKFNNFLEAGALRLSTQGLPAGFMPVSGGILFYGEGIDSNFTAANVYLMEKGGGHRIEVLEGEGPEPVDEIQTFVNEVHVEEDRLAATELFDNTESDFWLWEMMSADDPNGAQKSFEIPVEGLDRGGEARLRVHLKGGSSRTHHVVVELNGTPIGEEDFYELDAYTLEIVFSDEYLVYGANTVTVKARHAGEDGSVFYVDSFDLSYNCEYTAVEDRLFFRGDGHPVVTVNGFSGEDIWVFDISDPLNVVQVTAVTVDDAAGNYRVSLAPASPETEYLAIKREAIKQVGVENTVFETLWTLKDPSNKADYLVIIPDAFLTPAWVLANHRRPQALKTLVVFMEDIMLEFNHGINHPEAVRDFLDYAYHNWSWPPRYVVLMGEGTFDYKDFEGYGENRIPPILATTPAGLFAADNLFADVDGSNDMVPDISIGRLPAANKEELGAMIDKIIAYEQSPEGDWSKHVLMSADAPDADDNFPADSDAVAGLLPEGYTLGRIYLSEYTLDEGHQMLVDGIENGALLVNYLGKASMEHLAPMWDSQAQQFEGLLDMNDAAFLENGNRLPVFLGMASSVGHFEVPGYESLAEELLLNPDGGAVAAWASTGLSQNDQARLLDEGLFRAIFADGEKVLGEAVLQALAQGAESGVDEYVLGNYTLFGDPALQLK
jgi:Peptidase family C25